MFTLKNGVFVQIRKGSRLQKVIQGVLTVGNAVNVGTAYGNAQGIKLDSLLKLADVKVSSPVKALHFEWAYCAHMLYTALASCRQKTLCLLLASCSFHYRYMSVECVCDLLLDICIVCCALHCRLHRLSLADTMSSHNGQ